MINMNRHNFSIAFITMVLILTSTSAFGFRCGRKIVTEDMHEAQVIKACGSPTTARQLGYVVRGSYIPTHRSVSPGMNDNRLPGYGYFTEEVIMTEYVYNFGPRKLMRRLIFEGGVLVKIETIGYGYRETKSK